MGGSGSESDGFNFIRVEQINARHRHLFAKFFSVTTMSVLLQMKLFAGVCTVSGITLLTRPSLILRSPLEPSIVRLTRLSSSTLDPAALAVAALPIMSIGNIFWASIWSGDEKFVKISGTLLKVFVDMSSNTSSVCFY
jgi:hypothetical protein